VSRGAGLESRPIRYLIRRSCRLFSPLGCLIHRRRRTRRRCWTSKSATQGRPSPVLGRRPTPATLPSSAGSWSTQYAATAALTWTLGTTKWMCAACLAAFCAQWSRDYQPGPKPIPVAITRKRLELPAFRQLLRGRSYLCCAPRSCPRRGLTPGPGLCVLVNPSWDRTPSAQTSRSPRIGPPAFVFKVITRGMRRSAALTTVGDGNLLL
jgi:hypothetical protein